MITIDRNGKGLCGFEEMRKEDDWFREWLMAQAVAKCRVGTLKEITPLGMVVKIWELDQMKDKNMPHTMKPMMDDFG